MPRLDGRTAIVTGGASGIGRGVALGLLEAGARIIVHDVDDEGLQRLVNETGADGGRLKIRSVDVADAVAVRSAVEEVWQEWPVDILVTSAGVQIVKDPFDFTEQDWQHVLSVNVTGVWNYCQSVGRLMAANGGGSIINIASLASILASYERAPYMASKGAVGMLTRALALDLAERNIRVNAVGPGAVGDTGMAALAGGLQNDLAVAYTPMRRRATPSDVANAVIFLASDDSSMITGQLLMVDGGLSAGTQIGAPWHQSGNTAG